MGDGGRANLGAFRGGFAGRDQTGFGGGDEPGNFPQPGFGVGASFGGGPFGSDGGRGGRGAGWAGSGMDQNNNAGPSR